MKEFTCDHCGGTFNQGWSDEEAEAEALDKWGVANARTDPAMGVICDDCHKEFLAWLAEQPAS